MGKPVSPGRKTKFVNVEAGIEIIAVTDEDGTDYMNGREEASLKTLDFIEKHVIIRFRVAGVKQEVDLAVHYKNSKIHDDFYKQFKKGEFKPPRVAHIIKKVMYEPGEHRVLWDGRDDTPDNRLLLAGDYRIEINGRLWLFKKKHTVDFKVGKPEAYNYGVHYKKKGRMESSKKDIGYAEKSQKALKDKTGYMVYSQLNRHAMEAVEEMKSASVVNFSGHAGPFVLVFHGKEGGKYEAKDKSRLFMYKTSNMLSNDAAINVQKKSAFRDMLFMMINGCRAGNEAMIYQNIVHKFNPKGVDGKHGNNTTAALSSFQAFHGIKPADGKKNPATLKWFDISQNLSEQKQTRMIQKILTGIYVEKEDGKLGTETRKSIRNYQKAHPELEVTGQLDDATMKALKIGERSSGYFIPRNIADAMGYKGADITMGFVHKVGWDLAVDWAKSFWQDLGGGKGINTAASNAQASVDHRKRKQFKYNIYTLKGVSQESTLHPARYGAARE
ncbi:MAG: peptidoglycan-binding domain-containing protein [Candidatus Krumholzibacteriales bacterium]